MLMEQSDLNIIPDHEIEALARCLLPSIIAYFESDEGQAEFDQWKQQNAPKTPQDTS